MKVIALYLFWVHGTPCSRNTIFCRTSIQKITPFVRSSSAISSFLTTNLDHEEIQHSGFHYKTVMEGGKEGKREGEEGKEREGGGR